MTRIVKRPFARRPETALTLILVASSLPGCVTVSCDWPSTSPTANTTANAMDRAPCEQGGTDQDEIKTLGGSAIHRD